jgi:hypothetical protein
METINLTRNQHRPFSLVEFLLGDDTRPGWLDKALVAVYPACPMRTLPSSPLPELCGTNYQDCSEQQ